MLPACLCGIRAHPAPPLYGHRCIDVDIHTAGVTSQFRAHLEWQLHSAGFTSLPLLPRSLLFCLQTSCLLCVAYASSLHLVGITRAAHFFSLDRSHGAVRSVERAGVKGWWLAWWALLCIWPLPIYCLPLLVAKLNAVDALGNLVADGSSLGGRTGIKIWTPASRDGGVGGGVSVTVLLAVLAAHNVLLTCAESVFAHMITKTPVLDSLSASRDGPRDVAAGGCADSERC
jgi:hypothetical protein